MKNYFSYGLLCAVFLVQGVNAYTHVFVNETDGAIRVKANYATFLCSNSDFTLLVGESKTINVGGCQLTGIEATTGETPQGIMYKGTRTAPYTGNAEFHIFSGRSKKKLAIIRRGENDALDNF